MNINLSEQPIELVYRILTNEQQGMKRTKMRRNNYFLGVLRLRRRRSLGFEIRPLNRKRSGSFSEPFPDEEVQLLNSRGNQGYKTPGSKALRESNGGCLDTTLHLVNVHTQSLNSEIGMESSACSGIGH